MNLQFLKIKKKYKKGGLEIKSDLYWQYILLLTFILTCLVCLFDLFVFFKTGEDLAPSVINVKEKEIIKKERINSILEYFKERESVSSEIINSPSTIIDPSI